MDGHIKTEVYVIFTLIARCTEAERPPELKTKNVRENVVPGRWRSVVLEG